MSSGSGLATTPGIGSQPPPVGSQVPPAGSVPGRVGSQADAPGWQPGSSPNNLTPGTPPTSNTQNPGAQTQPGGASTFNPGQAGTSGSGNSGGTPTIAGPTR
jgi:hypothetical protein